MTTDKIEPPMPAFYLTDSNEVAIDIEMDGLRIQRVVLEPNSHGGYNFGPRLRTVFDTYEHAAPKTKAKVDRLLAECAYKQKAALDSLLARRDAEKRRKRRC